MTDHDDNATPKDVFEATIKALFAALPSDYAQRYAALESLRHIFHQQLGLALEPSLSEFAGSQPQDSPDQRKQLASLINEQLRNVGLAIKCPRTARPAVLVVDRQDAEHPEITRFRLGTRDSDGKYCHSFTSRELPKFSVIEDPPRVEPLARAFRSGGKSQGR